MNPDLLALTILNHPDFTLQEVTEAEPEARPSDRNTSYEMLSDEGELIGYIKTWQEGESFSGFVHFDVDGNVQDWKVFTETLPH